MKKYIVDRIEGDIVVLEDLSTKKIKNVSIEKLPKVKEGDALKYENKEYTLDNETKSKREEDIKAKFERLKGGD